MMRHFKVAVVKNGSERGIGVEEYQPGERSDVIYIASLYADGLSQRQTFDFYVEHILGLLNKGETARIRALDYAFSRKREFAKKYPEAEIVAYRRGQGKFKTVNTLAIDGINRKSNITEVLK